MYSLRVAPTSLRQFGRRAISTSSGVRDATNTTTGLKAAEETQDITALDRLLKAASESCAQLLFSIASDEI